MTRSRGGEVDSSLAGRVATPDHDHLLVLAEPGFHLRRAVVLTHAANTVVAQFFCERSVLENLENALRQTTWIIGLDQKTARRSLHDLSKRSASWLDHRHTTGHRFEQGHSLWLIVSCGH